MNYSDKLTLGDFFEAVHNQTYVVIKLSEDFPHYSANSDIDILCTDLAQFAKTILTVGNQYVEDLGYEIRVSVKESRQHAKIDFFLDGKLDFRFDLNQRWPQFEHIKVKSELLRDVLAEYNFTITIILFSY